MKKLISLLLLASSLLLPAQSPPILRQAYTTNTAAAADAVVNALIAAGITGKANTNITTGSGATVQSNAPTMSGALTFKDVQVLVTNSAANVTYNFNVPDNGSLSEQFNYYFGGTLFFEMDVSTNQWVFYDPLSNLNPFVIKHTSVIVNNTLAVNSNFTFATYQSVPTSNLTNYSVMATAEPWINATNNVNFSSMFLMGGAQAAVVSTTITNYSGSNRTLSFVGPTSVIWLSDVPTIITNGTGGLLATKHLSNKVFAVWAWQKSSQ